MIWIILALALIAVIAYYFLYYKKSTSSSSDINEGKATTKYNDVLAQRKWRR